MGDNGSFNLGNGKSSRSMLIKYSKNINIEKIRESVARIQLAVLNSVDPEKIEQAMKKQAELAANGNLESLKFLLSLYSRPSKYDVDE